LSSTSRSETDQDGQQLSSFVEGLVIINFHALSHFADNSQAYYNITSHFGFMPRCCAQQRTLCLGMNILAGFEVGPGSVAGKLSVQKNDKYDSWMCGV